MNIRLQPDVEKYVGEKVKTGQYRSPEEAVNGLLSRVRDQEELSDEDIADLRAEADLGIAEADRGEFVEFTAEDVIAERRAAFAARTKGA
jgi:putative addiction module CopG family antidote